MTVAELINALKKYEPNRKVGIMASYDCGYCYAGGKIEDISLGKYCPDFCEEDCDDWVFLVNDEG